MTEAQERALRKEVRSWRRPDDEFVYELVVVSSGDEALIAARLNVNLQAVVIRRRFSHQSTRDLSSLAEFVDTKISRRPRGPQIARRARRDSGHVAVEAAARTRSLPDDRDRGRRHRRPARPALPPGVPRPRGHPRAAPVDPAGRRRRGTARRSSARSRNTATGRPACSTRCRSRRASRSSTRTGSRTWSASTAWTCSWLRRRRPVADWTRCSNRPARCARRSNWPPRPSARATPSSSRTARRPPTRSSPRRWCSPATSCWSTATATSPTTTG